MSGEKYVQVTERQLSQMMSTCREVDQHRAVQARLKDELKQAENNIRRRAEEAQARYSRYESSLANMSTEMRNMDQAHTQRLREQRERFDAGLMNLGQRISNQRVEYLELLEEQEEEFRGALEDQRKELQGQIQNLATSIDRKQAHESDRASQWLKDTRTLLDEMDKGYRHREFTPGALDALRSELQFAEGNHNQGLHQAAVAAAQQTLLRSLELRLRLEKLEAEWDAHQAAALTSCREVLAYCDTLTTTRFSLETEAGTQELDAEIDYWTEGKLSLLQASVRQQVEALTQATPGTLPVECLKQAINDSSRWRQEAELLVQTARESLVLSQLRHDIAARVVDSLEQRGWFTEDSAYEGEAVDGRGWRNAYHLKLKNHAGDEVVTIIAPETSGVQGANRVTLSYFGQGNDARFNLALANSVRSALAETGLEVGEARSVPGFEGRREGDQTRRDFERVRQSQTTRQPTGSRG